MTRLNAEDANITDLMRVNGRKENRKCMITLNARNTNRTNLSKTVDRIVNGN